MWQGHRSSHCPGALRGWKPLGSSVSSSRAARLHARSCLGSQSLFQSKRAVKQTDGFWDSLISASFREKEILQGFCRAADPNVEGAGKFSGGTVPEM